MVFLLNTYYLSRQFDSGPSYVERNEVQNKVGYKRGEGKSQAEEGSMDINKREKIGG